MKILKLLIAISALGLILSACEKDFLDINKDPNSSVKVQPDLLFMGAVNEFACSSMDFGPGMMYWSKHWAAGSNNATVFADPERYQMSIYSPGNVWGQVYTNLMNLEHAKRYALENEVVNEWVQAEIMKSYFVYFLTAVWEEVPYSEALQIDKFPHPKYDKQEDILNSVVDNLTDAIAKIDDSKKGFDEILFEGDMAKWKKFGNFLKLKMLTLLAKKDQATYSTKLQAFLATSPALFASNADNVRFPFYDSDGNRNPFFKVWKNFSNSKPGYFYVSDEFLALIGTTDPRVATWFAYGKDNDDNTVNYWKGVTQGEPLPEGATFIGEGTIKPDAPFLFATYSEQEFLLAEIYANGLNGSVNMGTANTHYKTGIEENMKMWGVPAADITSAIGGFLDLTGMPEADAQKKVYEQMYIGYYFMPAETWIHVRRTGVPAVTPPKGAVTAGLIRRWTYPSNELSTNPNIPATKALDVKAWLDK
jgi:hypothetical protein